jgi:hypothetical protein
MIIEFVVSSGNILVICETSDSEPEGEKETEDSGEDGDLLDAEDFCCGFLVFAGADGVLLRNICVSMLAISLALPFWTG